MLHACLKQEPIKGFIGLPACMIICHAVAKVFQVYLHGMRTFLGLHRFREKIEDPVVTKITRRMCPGYQSFFLACGN